MQQLLIGEQNHPPRITEFARSGRPVIWSVASVGTAIRFPKSGHASESPKRSLRKKAKVRGHAAMWPAGPPLPIRVCMRRSRMQGGRPSISQIEASSHPESARGWAVAAAADTMISRPMFFPSGPPCRLRRHVHTWEVRETRIQASPRRPFFYLFPRRSKPSLISQHRPREERRAPAGAAASQLSLS